ncbi:Hypothetical_protein [Hexamita inflata]|uniref:Hypothetical_protein n=1 Tax=Hexamita inflata TaxID=28002 RepID=A0AA86NTB3_9EUKA|nr:Hypothetical protein HINF_LOCUS12101 [Hexamita inflata]
MTTSQRFQYGFDSSLRKPVHPSGSIVQPRVISFSRYSKHNVSLIAKLQIKLESRDILDCNRTREYQYTLRNNIFGSVLSHCQFKPEQYRNSSIYGLLRSDMLQYGKSRKKKIYLHYCISTDSGFRQPNVLITFLMLSSQKHPAPTQQYTVQCVVI